MSVVEVVDHALEVTRRGWNDPGYDSLCVTRTFLFADVVGSTKLIDAIGDSAWMHVLAWHERALGAVFERYEGELVDQAGDGFFVSFVAPRAAIECAIAVQRVLAYHRQEHGFALAIRIGVHQASVLSVGSAFRGKGVHVAARIAGLAAGGEILASTETVRTSRLDAPAAGSRREQLSGISDPVDVQLIQWAWPQEDVSGRRRRALFVRGAATGGST